jgi:hypothetical protein
MKKITFADCMQSYLSRTTLKKSTIMTYQSIYNVFLMHTIGKKIVQKINEKDIDSILQNIKEYKAN